jgi:hypothetical protein
MNIKSISEAFSMQPVNLIVSEKEGSFNPEDNIKEIKLEHLYVGADAYPFYVGYNFKGEKRFQYKAETMNVHYF